MKLGFDAFLKNDGCHVQKNQQLPNFAAVMVLHLYINRLQKADDAYNIPLKP